MPFDIIKSAGAGYGLIWEERRYLAKLALVPCIVKFCCYALISLLGWEENLLRQALVLLPSYFADGWLFCHLTRLLFLEHRWPFRPTGHIEKDMRVIADRAAGIVGGTLTFVVIKFLLAGAGALAYAVGLAGLAIQEQPEQGGNGGLFLLTLFLLGLFLWAFRLLWLYIPAAVNYPLRRFLKELGGYGASFSLIGTWLFCFLPPFFVFGKLLSFLDDAAQQGQPALEIHFLALVLHVLLDTGIGLLATAGLGYGFKNYVMSRVNASPGEKDS